ncbi:hypothetical protein GBP346_B0305 [Burkholderia pseudomallei MSHR346]|nr:hypothetical protein BUC_5213 [Burkholderia pseudomallei 576]EEP51491.1 hypothetical protein GBP346_B0305 [Burkholderia pseudomallei MSHR346]
MRIQTRRSMHRLSNIGGTPHLVSLSRSSRQGQLLKLQII